MCKKPLCYIRAFTTPLLRPSLFARVCVGSGGVKMGFQNTTPSPTKRKSSRIRRFPYRGRSTTWSCAKRGNGDGSRESV